MNGDQLWSEDELAAAAECCTEKQMDVVRLRNDGLGVRTIARTLGITPSAARERLDCANLRIRHAIEHGETAA